jgi:hypothetical protein
LKQVLVASNNLQKQWLGRYPVASTSALVTPVEPRQVRLVKQSIDALLLALQSL